MSDWIWFGAATAITYALSEAFKHEPKPPKRDPAKHRPTTPRAATHIPRTPRAESTRTDWPHRVPVDTSRHSAPPIVQNSTVQPSKPVAPRKGKRHTGTGPFGMSQREFKAAQRSSFKWSVGPDTYDDTVTGWITGISEGDETA